MDLDTSHIEQARNDTLLKTYLFNGAKLKVRSRATEKTALEYKTVIGHRDFCGPDRHHHHEKEDAAGRARDRGNQTLPLIVKDAGSSNAQQKDEPSEGTTDEGHPRTVMHDLVRTQTLLDIAHPKLKTSNGVWRPVTLVISDLPA